MLKARTLRALTIVVLTMVLAAPVGAQEAQNWQRMVAALEAGTRIELHLADGTHVQGTLVTYDADVVVLNPRTRIPVAPWRVAYSEIRSVDVKRDAAMAPGTKVLVGIGIGAGVAFLALLILVASIAD